MTEFEGQCTAAAVVVGVVAVWLVLLLHNERERGRSREAAARQAAAHAQYLRSALALSCSRCGELAYPLGGTANRYRCEGCGRQFAGARHPC